MRAKNSVLCRLIGHFKSNQNPLGRTFRKGNFSLMDSQKVVDGLVKIVLQFDRIQQCPCCDEPPVGRFQGFVVEPVLKSSRPALADELPVGNEKVDRRAEKLVDAVEGIAVNKFRTVITVKLDDFEGSIKFLCSPSRCSLKKNSAFQKDLVYRP
ncbi:MAG: hypothetical protein LBN92_05010 [Treponema sp.]|jgi:hypothetical protein|nr:hypothetical protein [Treponema sp.]